MLADARHNMAAWLAPVPVYPHASITATSTCPRPAFITTNHRPYPTHITLSSYKIQNGFLNQSKP